MLNPQSAPRSDLMFHLPDVSALDCEAAANNSSHAFRCSQQTAITGLECALENEGVRTSHLPSSCSSCVCVITLTSALARQKVSGTAVFVRK